MNIFCRVDDCRYMECGYTTWDKFEKLPKEWLYDSHFGYLCPECAKEFKIFVNKFFNGNLAPVWKLEEGDI